MMRAASSPLEPLNKNILLAGEVIAEKWKIGEKIGEGTFSQIYSAYSIESRDKVAVKVEAPSSLKPVLEWESLILKSLQDCPYVCRYYYHGKHGDSTVLVMELLGDSMSMLRMSPDSIHGVPLAKSVSVGLEMLDCIEAFHRHGYVHRDIKASNFALSALPDRHPLRQQRYYIIDFGLSRQHIGEDREVLPARPVAEFRGTSMYASLSSHRRQELGPKDDLWSWFYLVMDFMRGELPWAADAQLKNRQTVLSLKEHYTEMNPSLLVEGLPGAMQLLEMIYYLQSLKYEDFPDYAKIRRQLQAVGGSTLVSDKSDSGDEESSADKENQAVAAVSSIDWSAIESQRERSLAWVDKADELKHNDEASDALLTIAKRYNTFFDSDGLLFDEQMRIQSAVYRIEKKSRARSIFLAPPPIQSFVKRRQSEQKMRFDALRKRREKDFQVRQSLEIKNEERMALAASIQTFSEAVHGIVSGEGASKVQDGNAGSLRLLKSESSMEFFDSEDVGNRRNDYSAVEEATFSASQPQVSLAGIPLPAAAVSMPLNQLSHVVPPASLGTRWDRNPNDGGAVPPPPPSPGSFPPAQHSNAFGHRPPPPFTGRYPTKGEIPRPPVGFPPNRVPMHHPPPPPPHSTIPEHRQTSVPDRHYGAPVEAREDNIYGYQRPQKSSREKNGSSSVRQYTSETREDRGYGSHRITNSVRDSVVDRHYDTPRDIREDRGYTTYHRSPRETNATALDSHYDAPTKTTEDRGYGVQLPQKPQKFSRMSHKQYLSGGLRGHLQEKERYYEGKRSRSRSRSSRREQRRSRRRSYSRSSSRSCSRSYSVSPSRSPSRSMSPPSRSHRRTSRIYADRRRETRKVESKREHSRRQRSRSRSSSRSYSSRSPSASPPAKHYRRESPDVSHLKSLHRYSSHSTSRHRSHSKEYPTEYLKGHPKEYVKHYPKEYTKGSSREFAKGYPKEYVKEYSKEHVTEYPKKYFSKDYLKEHVRDYRRRSPSPDCRHSHSWDPQYRRSPSQDRHRSPPREYGRDDESWGVDIRFKPAPTPQKHRRSSRWQPRL